MKWVSTLNSYWWFQKSIQTKNTHHKKSGYIRLKCKEKNSISICKLKQIPTQKKSSADSDFRFYTEIRLKCNTFLDITTSENRLPFCGHT